MTNYPTWAWIGGTSSLIDATMVGSTVPLAGYTTDVVLNDANSDNLIGDTDGAGLPAAGDGITLDGTFYQITQMTSWNATVTMDDNTTTDLTMHIYRLSNGTLYYRLGDGSVTTFTAGGYHAGNITSIALTSFGGNFETFAPANFDAAFPLCFCKGTYIATAGGDIPVERIAVGTLVLTADAGLQPVRCVVSSVFTTQELADAENLCPVVIPAGSLGENLPSFDLSVSPQHRILINPRPLSRMENVEEILVPAKKLVGYNGIRYAEPVDEVIYYHLLLEDHQIIFANGVSTESFLVSPLSLQALHPSAQQELRAILPSHDWETESPMEPARPVLKKRARVQQLIKRCRKNGYDLIEPPQDRSAQAA